MSLFMILGKCVHLLPKYWGYIGIMENKMETTIMGCIGYIILGLYWGICNMRVIAVWVAKSGGSHYHTGPYVKVSILGTVIQAI